VKTNQTDGKTLSSQQAIQILAGAFKPLNCIARSQNVGTQIVFEVSDGGNRILKLGIPTALAHKDHDLRKQIMGARRAIEEKGVKLAPWEMP
jgi:hypothetical protein